jgi:phenylalanine-4-hydroxylase
VTSDKCPSEHPSVPPADRIPALESVPLLPEPSQHAGGERELVELTADHPGFRDPEYRRRRNVIAQLALDYEPGAPLPRVEYTENEHGVWRLVWQRLADLHGRVACREYLEASNRLRLDKSRVPQLSDVNTALLEQSDRLRAFRLAPVAGLVSARMFLSYLSRRVFLSTQYMRHHSVPLYTPEPDVIHELVGHAVSFAHPAFVEASVRFGEAALRSRDEEAVSRIARLYWFTLEFGVVKEGAALKAVGAGLLSSFGELGRFASEAKLLPFDASAIAATPYDPTDYQARLFVAPSFEAMFDEVARYLERT